MGSMKFFEKMIDQRMQDMHCAYIGKVIWTNGETAKVQPLGVAQAIVSDVPVACRYKITTKTITYATDAEGHTASQQVAVPVEIAKGDLVACLCADCDISMARRGSGDKPPAGNHSLSDSIIVGIL